MEWRYGPAWGWTVSLALLVGLAPVSWVLPTIVGYILSGLFVLTMIVLTIRYGRVSLVHWPVLAGLGIYWLVLIGHLGFTGELEVVPYIGLVPLAVAGLMLGGSQIVSEDPRGWAAGVVVVASFLATLGFVILCLHLLLGWSGPSMTGSRVLGLFQLRIASVYGNSNHLGFTTAVGAISATYLWQETKRRLWVALGAFLFISAVMSNARAAVVAGTLAIGIMAVHDRQDAIARLPVVVIATIAAVVTILSGFINELVRSLLLRFGTWEATIDAIAVNPLIGEAWGVSLGTHNMFLIVIHQTGLIGGFAYIAAHLFALWYAALTAKSGDTWDRYVFAMLVFLLVAQFFSTSTLGGLTTPSLLLALFVGLGGRRHGISIRRHRRAIVQRFPDQRPTRRTE